MAGRIRDADIARVRELSPIADVVAEYVTLRNAGGGSLKGLCPFHDERTPSFHVTPARGLWHCFGCGEGGDVITFVEKIEHLSFFEAVERLAARVGYELHYEQGPASLRGSGGQRQRLLAANTAAAAFFAAQLSDAPAARRFLTDRGFDDATISRYGLGFSPARWDELVRHLRREGFSDDDLVTAGLAIRGNRGLVDRFRGRLMWPIRDITGDIVGFGARKLDPADDGPKYLNTPETPLFKKSSVLYGIDLAKKDIARIRQAVIVEGYTDVMACHLAGVTTAVATCGTAFGEEHVRVLRRLLLDTSEFGGEVIFTFDADAAGRKAAMRAFESDQKFVAHTFIAVAPDGMDPCDLRLARGDAAVRDMIARRQPLFEFAIRSLLRDFNLDLPEGRVAALERTIPLVARIKDVSLRDEYARRLAGWVGVGDELAVVRRVRREAGGSARGPRPGAPGLRGSAADPRGTASGPRGTASGPRPPEAGPAADPAAAPDPRDPALQVEREALKLALQRPALLGPAFDALDAAAFRSPAYAEVRDAIEKAGGTATTAGGDGWVAAVLDAAPDDRIRRLVRELLVEPPFVDGEPDVRYAAAQVARLRVRLLDREIAELKSRLQRINPVEQPTEHTRLFAELVQLEKRRRDDLENYLGVG
ncbi:MAG: DNA primase [Acidothermus cellulolyticus]|nr:DNA primase [Acidothermus cellulolyticus]